MNSAWDATNKLSASEYMLKHLIKITNNTLPLYNFTVFLDAITRYVKLHHSLFGKYKGELMHKPKEDVLNTLSGTFKEFLVSEKLQPLIPMFLISHTAQGYGYIDEIGVLYGLMWNTPSLVISMVLGTLGVDEDLYKAHLLKNGFEHVWNTIVKEEQLDIRFNIDIKMIYRNNKGVRIHYEDATSQLLVEKCDFLIWTPPMPDLLKHLSKPSKVERHLFKSLTSHVAASSLMSATGTIRNRPLVYYQQSISEKLDYAVTSDMDVEGALTYCDTNVTQYDEMNDTPRIITFLQRGRLASNEEKLNEIAKMHYQKRFNSTNIEIFNTRMWPYFYKWAPKEISNGNHWKVFEMQGNHRTWYAGASVCFESVKSVMEYNNLLLRQLGNVNSATDFRVNHKTF